MFINNIVNKRKQDLIETYNNLYYVNNNKTWALLQNKDIWTLYLVCSSIFDFKIWGSIKNPKLTILYIKMGKNCKILAHAVFRLITIKLIEVGESNTGYRKKCTPGSATT